MYFKKNLQKSGKLSLEIHCLHHLGLSGQPAKIA